MLAEAGRVLAARSTTRRRCARRVAGGARAGRLVHGRRPRRSAELERVAVAHADPARAELAREIRGASGRPGRRPGAGGVRDAAGAELHPRGPDELHVQARARRPRTTSCSRSVGVRSASVPMTLRGQRLGVDDARHPPSRAARSASSSRCSRSSARRAAVAVDSARLYRPALGDRPHAAELAAAAGAAGDRRHRDRRRCTARPARARRRRRLLRPLHRRRGRVDRGDRRRLRQGRRGRGRDRAGPLHDPGGGGAAALARRDPALAQRRDAPRRTATAASARSPACTSTRRARRRA